MNTKLVSLDHFYLNRETTYLLYIFLFLFSLSFLIVSLNVTADLHEVQKRCSPITFFWKGNSNACTQLIETSSKNVVGKPMKTSSIESFVSTVCTTPDQKYISVVSTTKTIYEQIKSFVDSIIEKMVFFQILIKSYVWVLYTYIFQ